MVTSKDFCLRTTQGRVISYFTQTCYGATSDCSEIARRFFGVPQHKIVTVPLGTDTDIFYPAVDVEARRTARSKLDYSDDDKRLGHEIALIELRHDEYPECRTSIMALSK